MPPSHVCESKDDIRKRLKRSTDGADAIRLALYCDAVKEAPGRMEYIQIPDIFDRDYNSW